MLRRINRPKGSEWVAWRGGRKPELCKLKADELGITERISDDVIILTSNSLCQKRGTYINIIGSSVKVLFLTGVLAYQWRTRR